jgi:hypothetical protein
MTKPVDEREKAEAMNARRSEWASRSLDFFCKKSRTDYADAVCDFLCDLMHFCDRSSFMFIEELRKALYHYEAETLVVLQEEGLRAKPEITYYCPRGCNVFASRFGPDECGGCGTLMTEDSTQYDEVHERIESESMRAYLRSEFPKATEEELDEIMEFEEEESF